MNELQDPEGNVARAISDTTDTVLLGAACMCTASHEAPTKSVIANAPMIRSVRAAFLPAGRRKALTPFEIDSTPVSAAAPDANARRSTKTPTAPAPAASGCGTWACGQAPAAHFETPVPIITKNATTNAYVGTANRIPASRTPRRFASVRISTKSSERGTLCEASDGAADESATTPAVTETATVRM